MNNKKLSVDYLINCTSDELLIIPGDSLIRFCIDSVEKQNHERELYTFILKSLIKIIPVDTVEEKLLKYVLPHISKYIEKLIENIEETNLTNESINNFDTIIAINQSIVAALKHPYSDEYFSVWKLNSLLIHSLKILQKLYRFCERIRNDNSNDNNLCQEIKNLLIQSQQVQLTLIKFVTGNNIQYFTQKCDDIRKHELDHFLELLTLLCDIGQLIPMIDTKSTAEIWKCISKLSTENSKNLIVGSRQINKEHLQWGWLYKSNNFLCNEIYEGIIDITTNPLQPFQNVERVLRITSFYLKILLRFVNDFHTHYCFEEYSNIIRVLFLLHNINSNIELSTEVIVGIQQNLTVGFINILYLIYKDSIFVKVLKESLINETPYEPFLLICIEILKKIFIENDNELLSLYIVTDDSPCIISSLFECIPKCTTLIFEKKNIYRNLIIYISNVIILTSNNPEQLKLYEEILVKSVLQNNLFMGYLSLDIWNLLTRFINPEQRYNYFIFWVKLYEHISNDSIEISHVFVQCLIENLYHFQSDYYKNLIKMNKSIVGGKMKLLPILGLLKIPVNDRLMQSYRNISNNAINNIANFLLLKDSECYYEMLKNLKLLRNYAMSDDEQLRSSLLTLWKNISFNNNDINKYSTIIISILDIFICFKNNFSNQQYNLIIENLLEIQSPINYLKLSFLKYIQHITVLSFEVDENQKILLNNLSNLINRLLNDNDIIIREKSLILYKNIAFNVEYDCLILNSVKHDVLLKKNIANFLEEQLQTEEFKLDRNNLTTLYESEFYHRCDENCCK